MKLYTWKDAERNLLLHKDEWGTDITDVEIYTDEMIVYIKEKSSQKNAGDILHKIFGAGYKGESQKVLLNAPGESLDVIFEVEEETKKSFLNLRCLKMFYMKSPLITAN